MSTISSIKIGSKTYDIKDPNTYTADEIDKLIEESASSSSSSSGGNSDVLEIYGNTPYIDFHYGNSTDDYTSRIIENNSGTLTVYQNLTVANKVSTTNLAATGTTVTGASSCVASGSSSHAEGTAGSDGTTTYYSTASGTASHSEGAGSRATGDYSHAEGGITLASGSSAHSEGLLTTASGTQSHAEGSSTTSSGTCSHSEGKETKAVGNYCHAEGIGSTAGSSSNVSGLTYNHAEGSYTTASGYAAHAEGRESEASGFYSHAEGYGTATSGYYSHAEGASTTASGESSHAEGYSTNAKGAYSHAEGFSAVTEGDYSHAEGHKTTASGGDSHAEGYTTTARGEESHAEGNWTTASGYAAHAEGTNTEASGPYSHAEGDSTEASGEFSHAEGGSTLATGDYSHAEGICTIALDYQLAIGHYNDIEKSTASTGLGTGTGTIFVIGNGTEATASNAFRVDQNGKIYAKSSSISTGADYAEYSEWADGNPEEEDRRGYFVTLDGKQIKIANSGDYILGVVSGNPCVIGNGDECWQGEFLRDEFDSYIYKEYTKEVENEDGTTETKTYTFYDVNPDYDPEQKYISRDQRPEWAAVGWMGQLPVRDDGTCEVNEYCIPADGGIATACEAGTAGCYRVIERISDNIVRIILK